MNIEELNVILHGDSAKNYRASTKPILAAIKMNNGCRISVQASSNHYCSPRSDWGPYSAVEVGIIEGERPPEAWNKYLDSHTESLSVYGYVPIGMVVDFINAPNEQED